MSTSTGLALPAAVLDRYVAEWTAAPGFAATFRRERAGTSPEASLTGRTEATFAPPRGPTVGFQLDRQGTVTGRPPLGRQ